MQSEVYLQSHATDAASTKEVNADAVNAGDPDYVVFNGLANGYDRVPLSVRAGQRVRFWVVDAGPSRSSSFHVVGAQFDTVYREGGYLLSRGRDGLGGTAGGAQVLGLHAAEGGFVETVFPEQGVRPGEPRDGRRRAGSPRRRAGDRIPAVMEAFQPIQATIVTVSDEVHSGMDGEPRRPVGRRTPRPPRSPNPSGGRSRRHRADPLSCNGCAPVWLTPGDDLGRYRHRASDLSVDAIAPLLDYQVPGICEEIRRRGAATVASALVSARWPG